MSRRAASIGAAGVVLLLALAVAGYSLHRMNLRAMAGHLRSGPGPNDTGRVPLDKSFWDENYMRQTTVEATLVELGASLRDGKVVDPEGKELCFTGARKHRPTADRQAARIAKLAEVYHVIEMYGPPGKD